MNDQKNKEQELENDFQDTEVNEPQNKNQDSKSENLDVDSKIEELQEELTKEKNSFLRLFAEFENYKKRTTKERIELYGTANKELMTVLLPILDDFERGLNEIEKSGEDSLLEGMKLIFNKFKNTLSQKGLKEMEVKQGDVFDAELHEAISQIPAPSKKLKGKIIDVVEKGYLLGETIIRFPKVVLGN